MFERLCPQAQNSDGNGYDVWRMHVPEARDSIAFSQHYMGIHTRYHTSI